MATADTTSDRAAPRGAEQLALEFLSRVWGPAPDLEAFANPAGDRVVSRWVCTGRNNGMLGLPADGRPVRFTGIAIRTVRDGRLAECWVERSAWELYQDLTRAE